MLRLSEVELKRPDFNLEREVCRKGCRLIIGIDEVGRGALAGPLVVGAVAFDPVNYQADDLFCRIKEKKVFVDDSKRLNALHRRALAGLIMERACFYQAARVEVNEINRLGIVRATHLGARRAIKPLLGRLRKEAGFVLSDYLTIPYLKGVGRKGQQGVVKGDQLSISIAAASIVAKVYRDGLMEDLGKKKAYRFYGWDKNKGYGTKLHQEMIVKKGATKHHRKGFIRAIKLKLF